MQTDETKANEINFDLVDQIVSLVPDWTWSAVKDALITAIVDNMPSTIVEKLTNDPLDFDRAQEILIDYYKPEGFDRQLIIDSFKILGPDYTCQILDSLQLNKHDISSNTIA